MSTTNQPITWIQIYTGVFSTISALLLAICCNFLWEMKEWKGMKDEADMQRDASISQLKDDVKQTNEESNRFGNRISMLEALKPREQEYKRKR